jgi:hypothetical protein
MKKSAAKAKRGRKPKETSKTNEVFDEVKNEVLEQALEVKNETPEGVVLEVEIQTPKEADSPEKDKSLEKAEAAYSRFVNIYSPPVVTTDNSSLEKDENGRYFIKVLCRSAKDSVPKWIDGFRVVVE